MNEEKIKRLIAAVEAVGEVSLLTYGTYDHPSVGGITGPMVVVAPREMSEMQDALADLKA